MEKPEVYNFGSDNNGLGNAWPLLAMNNGWGNGGFLGGGFGGSLIGGFLGSIFPNLFGRGMGNCGNNNSDLIVQAVTSQGQQSVQAVQTLSTMLGQDFNTVNDQITAISGVLNQLAVQNATTPLQVINAVNSGNAALQSQLCQCCCENRLLTTEQGYQAQIRTIEQTNQLGSQADRNTASIVGAIANLQTSMTKEFCDVKEREMQSKIDSQAEIITQLRNNENNAQQTAQFAAMLAPIQAQLNAIAAKQPNTVPVQWPNIQAVNVTPNYNGYGYNGFGYNGYNGYF